jgi:predicted LPLAT superfamily acyltransferase
VSEGEATRPPSRAAWLSEKERGSILAIRFLVLLCNLFGRTLTRAFVHVLMVYYTAASSKARDASRAWLTRAFGRPATLVEVYRHLTTFALVALDRIFLLQGKTKLFEIESHGTEHLRKLSDEQKGAILLGAHIGSFEAMRAQGSGKGYDIHVLAYLENARKITAVLSALAPEMHDRVIGLGSVDSLFRARDVLEKGAMLALLGDRTGLNEKRVLADFCGQPAPFPSGPFLLAHSLQCPVLLVVGVYRGKNRYDIYCEPFAERVVLDRRDRQGSVQHYVQAYAKRIEEVALAHPYNWFNIYDFWKPER